MVTVTGLLRKQNESHGLWQAARNWLGDKPTALMRENTIPPQFIFIKEKLYLLHFSQQVWSMLFFSFWESVSACSRAWLDGIGHLDLANSGMEMVPTFQ